MRELGLESSDGLAHNEDEFHVGIEGADAFGCLVAAEVARRLLDQDRMIADDVRWHLSHVPVEAALVVDVAVEEVDLVEVGAVELERHRYARIERQVAYERIRARLLHADDERVRVERPTTRLDLRRKCKRGASEENPQQADQYCYHYILLVFAFNFSRHQRHFIVVLSNNRQMFDPKRVVEENKTKKRREQNEPDVFNAMIMCGNDVKTRRRRNASNSVVCRKTE